MGLDYHGVKTIAYAKSLHPHLNSLAMIGRQNLHASRESIEMIFNEFGITYSESELTDLIKGGDGYCEPLLEKIGFDQIDSYDYSDYEGPTHTHDFNLPISPNHHQRYDVVVDGGSLEHIFNFPIALRNAMEMVKSGGLFITLTPCNNECGHGFYQFSPELYFSLMCEENGYQLIDLFCHEIPAASSWFRPKRPSELKKRLNIITRKPIMMIVMAKRIDSQLPIFNVQQSDYQIRWSGDELDTSTVRSHNIPFKTKIRRFLVSLIPVRIRLQIRSFIEPESFAPEYFVQIDRLGNSNPDDLSF